MPMLAVVCHLEEENKMPRSMVMTEFKRGIVLTHFLVRCAGCLDHIEHYAENEGGVFVFLVKVGWRLNAELAGWVCPKCVETRGNQ
jgi:hypothetical protein